MKKLAFIITHPIQYYAPLFQHINERQRIAIKVFYTKGKFEQYFDEGFAKTIAWDIPLLEGYEYTFLKNSGGKLPGQFFSIVNSDLIPAIEAWQPDAICVFGWNYYSHLKVMRYFKGKLPVLFRGDSTLLDSLPGYKKLLRRFFLRWVYHHVDIALAVGKNSAAYFKWCGLNDAQIIVAPHAVDNERFANSVNDDEVRALRISLQIPSDAMLVLFAGKFEPKKNPALLINAFLEAALKNAHLLMVGNGVLETSLKQLAGNASNIHFLPFQNQSKLPLFYHASDVFVLPSDGPGETWGLAVNEAMACGKPIIVSDKVGCAIDLVEPGKNGWIFPHGNQPALVEVLRKLNNQELANNMGHFSQQKITHFSFTNIASVIEDCMSKN